MCVILLAVTLFYFGVAPDKFRQSDSRGKSNLSTAEIAELISQTGRRTTLMTGRMADYTFTAEIKERKCDKRDAVKREVVKVYEAYPAFGRTSVRIFISENGVSRDPKEVERERRRAASDLIEAEKRAAKAREYTSAAEVTPLNQSYHSYGVNAGRGDGRFYIRPTDFLQSHVFFGPRRSRYNGREAITLNFRPPYSDRGSDSSSRVRMRLAGRIWIDAVEKVIIRLEALPLEEADDSMEIAAKLVEPNLPRHP